ncbi:hypothetical protein BTO05_05485 [Winogradskyella sp. PC-19]|jgi:uncharacterized membrane protein (UPF0127 family)|uniref:DUF192 domain-containing protein n=1 Tax=unclassified Winogradskyella TaxID=2615021 RepID=UPI000B3C35FA|nr:MULTISPECIES: DUF192 domain-containing protein [unclassified Winogradskyella]ARV09114.1 hypothetical protein BTO05_05485 [Winogradskyella sp. PC-19]RZN78884.1 MAG: DUF192 domain-containing protein [Winogradskyella sp.]
MVFGKFLRLLLLLVFTLCVIACKDSSSKKESKSLTITFKKEGVLQLIEASKDSIIKELDIEIADDEYQTQTGLMYRDSMEDNQGMLFIFPNEAPRSFYMKNTRIPLDIIYISADSTIVSFQKNAKPFDETSLPSNAAAKFVLEINAGLADTWQLQIGDKVDF